MSEINPFLKGLTLRIINAFIKVDFAHLWKKSLSTMKPVPEYMNLQRIKKPWQY